MGSLCGCDSKLANQSFTNIQINEQLINNSVKSQEHSSKRHFQDIVPQNAYQNNKIKLINEGDKQKQRCIFSNVNSKTQRNKQNVPIIDSQLVYNKINDTQIQEGQNSLWKLNNQLSTLVCTFQKNNGQLTKTFLDKSVNKYRNSTESNKNEDYQIQNVSQINNMRLIDQFQKQRRNSKPIQRLQLQKNNLRENNNDNKQGIRQNYIQKQKQSNKALPQQSQKISYKESKKISMQSQQNKDKIRSLVQKQHSPQQNMIQSQDQTQNNLNQQGTQNEFQQYLKTYLLDSQLKTERCQQKQFFYQKSSIINGKQTLHWEDENRIGFECEIKKFSQLQVINLLLSELGQQQKQTLYNMIFTILGSIYTYQKNHQIKLISYHQSEQTYKFRIFANGGKRVITFNKTKTLQQSIFQLINQFVNLYKLRSQKPLKSQQLILSEAPLFGIYYLTGWIPQSIHLKQISQFEGILQRINSNFSEGHTIITFSQYKDKLNRRQTQDRKHLYLISIMFQQNLLKVNDGLSWFNQQNNGDFYIEWQQFLQSYDVINVNWNPCIYDYSYQMQGQIKSQILQNTLRSQFPQYHLKIPASKQDIEVRLFIEAHSSVIPQRNNLLNYSIQLYDYNGFIAHNSGDCIRNSCSLNKVKDLHSDVFIFQASQQKTEYLLVLVPQIIKAEDKINLKIEQGILYTFSINSFNHLFVKQLKKKEVRYTIQQKAIVSPMNQGFSINSPNFLKNLQFNLQVPPLSHMRLTVETQKSHIYDINIIADPQNCKDIVKLNLQNLLNDNFRSCQIEGNGCCEFISKYQSYILVIAGFNQYKGKVNIKLDYLGDATNKSFRTAQINSQQVLSSNILQRKSTCSNLSAHQRQRSSIMKQIINPVIMIKQIVFNPNIIFEKKIKWSTINPGPRKRLKSNSTPAYHPYTTFEQFFRNPFVDKSLQKGIYQFNIVSKSYQDLFNQTIDKQAKSLLQPPTLSLAILRMSSNQKSFKIINDDAFYVPFGIGYWCQQLLLEQGKYRFVFSKIQKDNSIGLFRIRKK